MNTKEHFEYIDIAKGVAILCIVMGHIYSTNFIKVWICSFHLAVFFMISGYLNRKLYGDTIKRWKKVIYRSARLLIPYYIFGLLYIVIQNLLYGVPYSKQIRDLALFKGAGALWFIPVLIASEVLFEILKRLTTKKYILMLASLIFGYACYVVTYYYCYTEITRFILKCSIALLFIMLGYMLAEKRFLWNLPIPLIVLLVCISIVSANINGMVDLYANIVNNPILYIVNSLLGFILVLNISKRIEDSVLFKNLGVNSLIIMCTHQNIIYIIRNIANTDMRDYLLGTIMLILVLLIEIPIEKLINRKAYFLVGK